MNLITQKKPYFSVVMPLYNCATYVGCAIESVLRQTYADWELVIVDDCSSDASPEIIRKYAEKDSRIRIFRNTQNLNISKTLNRAISMSRGMWIAHVDSDDFFNPNYLERLQNYTKKHPNYFFSCWVTVVNEHGEKVLDIKLPSAEKIKKMIRIENFLYHPATVFKRLMWERVGGYVINNRTVAEDGDLWIKFFNSGIELMMIPEFLINYRIHYSNITTLNDAQITNSHRSEIKKIRQYHEWRTSLFLKQKMPDRAREEIKMLYEKQKKLSLKNIQYLSLTFLPPFMVDLFMWDIRPRLRYFWRKMLGPRVRI